MLKLIKVKRGMNLERFYDFFQMHYIRFRSLTLIEAAETLISNQESETFLNNQFRLLFTSPLAISQSHELKVPR